ncbi:MAG: hypothetical protein KW804_03520 [Candidatus Doudnabacteria bacterium]|nr:hypothetical protein [Candidatus Doudnabacteria bacterium]
MKKVSKTKKTATKFVAKKVVKTKAYEAHYLAMILLGFLLLEGFLSTSTKMSDWDRGLEVLDMSSSVAQTTSDLEIVMQPIATAFEGVNEFYELAATEMIQILDMSGVNPMEDVVFVTSGVTEFYQQASVELISFLDFSDSRSWPAKVAGVTVSY